MAIAKRYYGNRWRLFLLCAGLLFCRLKAANSPLAKAIREPASSEEIKTLIQSADEVSLRAALVDIMQMDQGASWRHFDVFNALLDAGEYDQEDLKALFSTAVQGKTLFFIRELIKKGARPSAEQKAQLLQDFNRANLLDIAIYARNRQWAQELVQDKIVGFGEVIVDTTDKERAFVEELLPHASQANLDEAVLEVLGEGAEWLMVSLKNAGANFPTVNDLFVPGQPGPGTGEWHRLVQLFVKKGLSTPIEIIEQALLKDFPLPNYSKFVHSLFGGNPIKALLKRASETKNRDLIHRMSEKRLLGPGSAIEYAHEIADPWLQEAIDAWLGLPVGKEEAPDLLGRATPINTSLRHFPVLLLIDQHGNEGISTMKSIFGGGYLDVFIKYNTVTPRLRDSVVWDRKLIIASRGITCGLLALAYTGRGDRHDSLWNGINANWKVYNVPETQFTVWIPNDYAEYYAQILNVDGFQVLLTSTKQEVLRYCPPVAVRPSDPRIQVKPYTVQDLEKIFKSKAHRPQALGAMVRQEAIKLEEYSEQERKQIFEPEQRDVVDVLIHGHGLSGVSMAGLPISQDVDERQRITSLLTFFSKKLDTGVVYVETCSAGGRNTTLLQTRKDGIARDYNFILVIGSVSDKVTRYTSEVSMHQMDRFFTQAAQLAQDNKAWESLLETIIAPIPAGHDVSGYAGFPQVWLPGQLGFQSPNVHQDVLSVGKVTAAVQGQTDDVILVDGRLAVLWYPRVLEAPVTISWTRAKDPGYLLRSTQWKYASAIGELVGFKVDQSVARSVSREQFPALARFFEQKGASTWMQEGQSNLYPEFVSMDRGTPRRLWFKRIELSDSGNPLMGVLRFLRDAFFHVGSEPKDILIEQLEGINDFAIHTEAVRLSEGVNDKYPLEELMQPMAGQRITLRNVMVRINSPEYPGELVLYIEYGGQYWSYRLRMEGQVGPLRAVGPGIWNFRETEAPPIEEFKKALAQDMPPDEQKTAYEVTKGKFERLKRGMGPEQWTKFKGRLYPRLPKMQPVPAAE